MMIFLFFVIVFSLGFLRDWSSRRIAKNHEKMGVFFTFSGSVWCFTFLGPDLAQEICGIRGCFSAFSGFGLVSGSSFSFFSSDVRGKTGKSEMKKTFLFFFYFFFSLLKKEKNKLPLLRFWQAVTSMRSRANKQYCARQGTVLVGAELRNAQ